MKEYDVIAVGTGSVMAVVEAMIEANPQIKVAVIDKDEPGGICLTRGCIPSKILLYPADPGPGGRRLPHERHRPGNSKAPAAGRRDRWRLHRCGIRILPGGDGRDRNDPGEESSVPPGGGARGFPNRPNAPERSHAD